MWCTEPSCRPPRRSAGARRRAVARTAARARSPATSVRRPTAVAASAIARKRAGRASLRRHQPPLRRARALHVVVLEHGLARRGDLDEPKPPPSAARKRSTAGAAVVGVAVGQREARRARQRELGDACRRRVASRPPRRPLGVRLRRRRRTRRARLRRRGTARLTRPPRRRSAARPGAAPPASISFCPSSGSSFSAEGDDLRQALLVVVERLGDVVARSSLHVLADHQQVRDADRLDGVVDAGYSPPSISASW